METGDCINFSNICQAPNNVWLILLVYSIYIHLSNSRHFGRKVFKLQVAGVKCGHSCRRGNFKDLVNSILSYLLKSSSKQECTSQRSTTSCKLAIFLNFWNIEDAHANCNVYTHCLHLNPTTKLLWLHGLFNQIYVGHCVDCNSVGKVGIILLHWGLKLKFRQGFFEAGLLAMRGFCSNCLQLHLKGITNRRAKTLQKERNKTSGQHKTFWTSLWDPFKKLHYLDKDILLFQTTLGKGFCWLWNFPYKSHNSRSDASM